MTKPREPEDQRLSALYQKTPRDEPSAQMDAAIKKLAHGAVRKPWITLPRMAMAASVLLMAGVGVKVYYQPEAEMDYAPAMPLFPDQAVQQKSAPAKRLKPMVEQDCQIPQALLNQDASTWQAYIQNLREMDRQTEADCLQKLAPDDE